jgi:hypothetical protein
MKKSLLSIALALFAFGANAEGIDAVGANIEILPSTKHGITVEARQWKAWTWVVNTGMRFDSNGQGNNQDNENYNVIWGTPPADAAGKEWYEVDYNMEDGIGMNDFTGEDVVWEEHQAPFTSNTDKYNDAPVSYQWITSEIMGEIYLRRTFTTDRLLAGDVYLSCAHDDAPCEYYLNGVLIWSATDGWDESAIYKLTEEQKALIHKDGTTENVLAVHVHQNWGGALADCGLYTLVPGGLEMGYVTPWTGKTIFNSCGGYNFDGQSNTANPMHGWEKLYEAKEGDVYTVHMESESFDDWESQLHFKTPINIDPTHKYTFKTTLTATADYSVRVKLCEMNDDEIVLSDGNIELTANTPATYTVDFEGTEVANFKAVFDLNWGTKGSDVQFSEMSLMDNTDNKELWVGTHYFNYMYFKDAGVYVKDPEITGRQETMAWTQADFDDSNWDDTAMPVGNTDYMPEVQTAWPDGINNNKERTESTSENTGYWIRRNFTLDEINPKLSYALNVCHDDDYKTYVNGVLLQEFRGWTNGKNPKQVHIPSKYLKVGNNVIATEIHQNWGGRFYDCGINVEEVDYDACAQLVRDAMALATTDKDLTQAMKDSLQTLVDKANHELEVNKDAAELKEYAKNLTEAINTVLGWSENVTILRQTIAICNNTYNKEYLAEKLTAAKDGIEACKDNDAVNKLLNELRIARKRNAAERHTEPFVGSQPEADGEYFIYNVGEKQFLAGGDNWGAHLALAYASNAMKLVGTTRVQVNNDTGETTGGEPIEGGFRIETFRANGAIGTDDFVNWGGYVDTNTDDAWKFVPVEGKTNVFNIVRLNCQDTQESGEPFLLGWRGGDNQNGYSYNVVDTDMNTESLESNQWMLISKEEWDALLANATNEAPIDATYLITNPGFDQRLTIDPWQLNNEGGNAGIWERGSNHSDFPFEGFNTTSFELTQELFDEALVPGWYTLSVQGYYRDGSYDEAAAKIAEGTELARNANLFVNEAKTPLVSIAEGNNQVPGLGRANADGTVRIPDSTTSAAVDYFQNGLYTNTIKFELTEAGYLLLGVDKYEGTENDWIVVDNFRLKYWGADEPDAIKNVENTVVNNTKAIYNLQGQKLQKAVKGVNIINGRKVVIK